MATLKSTFGSRADIVDELLKIAGHIQQFQALARQEDFAGNVHSAKRTNDDGTVVVYTPSSPDHTPVTILGAPSLTNGNLLGLNLTIPYRRSASGFVPAVSWFLPDGEEVTIGTPEVNLISAMIGVVEELETALDKITLPGKEATIFNHAVEEVYNTSAAMAAVRPITRDVLDHVTLIRNIDLRIPVLLTPNGSLASALKFNNN